MMFAPQYLARPCAEYNIMGIAVLWSLYDAPIISLSKNDDAHLFLTGPSILGVGHSFHRPDEKLERRRGDMVLPAKWIVQQEISNALVRWPSNEILKNGRI